MNTKKSTMVKIKAVENGLLVSYRDDDEKRDFVFTTMENLTEFLTDHFVKPEPKKEPVKKTSKKEV